MANQVAEARELSMEERKACHLFEAGMYYAGYMVGVPANAMPDVLGIAHEHSALYAYAMQSVAKELTILAIVESAVATLNERVKPDGSLVLPTLEETLQLYLEQEHGK